MPKMVNKPGDTYGHFRLLHTIKGGGNYWMCQCIHCGIEQKKKIYFLKQDIGTICTNCYGSGKEKSNIYGDFKLEGKAENGRCIFTCINCGNRVEKYLNHLKNGVGNKCDKCNPNAIKHHKKGETFGDFELYDYIEKSDGRWICKCTKCGYTKEVSVYDLKKGHGIICRECNPYEREHIDISSMQFGWLTPLEYIGHGGKWKCRCSLCGSEKEYSSSNLLSGSTKSCGCWMNKEDLTGNTVDNWYIIGKSDDKKYRYICKCTKCGNIQEISSTDLKLGYGKRCYKCFPKGRSTYEIELAERYKGAIVNSRDIVKGTELDLYYQDKGIAIEVNGVYWHSSLFKSKDYHKNKTFQCVKNGIRLIHIYEYELLGDNKEKILNYLDDILGDKEKDIIYARNTEVRFIDTKEAKEFLNKYHLQSYASSSIQIGLFYNNEIVGCMTFGSPRFNSEYQYELVRLCFKHNVNVVGGAEKMFKYFKQEMKPESIISYCDIGKFLGKVYYKLGFKLDGFSSPSYVWVNLRNMTVMKRYQTSKSRIIKQWGLIGYDDKTEDEIMTDFGFLKIHDSGNARFVWKK